MHVHLPKPLHGWRALAGEVGIIVVGVLIALAAEQTVQAVHERSIAREARNNVIAEIEQDMDVFRRRAQIQPCIDRRLDEIEQLIRAAPAPLPRLFGSDDRRCGKCTHSAGTPLRSEGGQAS
jgi:type II secretory pathway pseudopilin PulG